MPEFRCFYTFRVMFVYQKRGKNSMREGFFDEKSRYFYVRPAGRTYLEVKVLYRPGRGNC